MKSIKDLKSGYRVGPVLGLFLNGKAIGSGELQKYKCGSVSTDAVGLKEEYRKKGHGIHLYLHLIRTAARIGAKRIYSSRALNKFSKRMWSEKLAAHFDVKATYTTGHCRRCGQRGRRVSRYYISL